MRSFRVRTVTTSSSTSGWDDQQLKAARLELDYVGRSILQMQLYVEMLPENAQPMARKALGTAFRAGSSFRKLDQMPLDPPMDEDGMLKLGPEIRQHIKQTRQFYEELRELRRITDIFHQETEALLRKLVRTDHPNLSDTTESEFAMAI